MGLVSVYETEFVLRSLMAWGNNWGFVNSEQKKARIVGYKLMILIRGQKREWRVDFSYQNCEI